MDPINRREHYRIPYAEQDRPRLVVGTAICEVIDCSETGVRFRPSAALDLAAGAGLGGRLRLRCGSDVALRGTVVRAGEDEVALRLEERGIPFRLILREQIELRVQARREA